MPRIAVPSLILTGMHDELTPTCAMAMQRALPNAQLRIFKNSSHMPFWEEPAEYFPVLLKFLDAHRSRSRSVKKRRR
jgi:proline iminopeptidase